MTVTEIPTRTVPTRRVSFEYPLADLPRHFAADEDIVMSHVIAVLSSVFPNGEDFFVRSVRNFRDQIEDPALKEQVKGFIGQEAIHGREHREFNDRLDELGYPSKRIDRFVDRSLKIREKLLPAKANLAATAALEHYTATLAQILLTDPAARDTVAHPEVRNLFLWHALEESEHKAVAFDVYRYVGGTERMRKVTMTIFNIGFPAAVAVMTFLSMLRDPVARRSPRRVWKSLKKLRYTPFVSREIVAQLHDYQREDFHPDDHPTDELVAHWREELFGAAGSLNDRLPAPRAS
ncbi:metal-dependent hydrolase [Actinospongicola halichondriae]|uniref:metal-dependent hydrolase n=1 Tax=Actinospongicola halichondriae TaxID=3236844 RepID=UPI003D5D1863